MLRLGFIRGCGISGWVWARSFLNALELSFEVIDILVVVAMDRN